ncbi:ClpXP protease specificity-enhancing factor [Denitratisoma sp. DHT3]|uniref:ClpXP protease specificity-enhancing factor n=1 Tax=Denitratisoma sp. DHT3 TaxID=1981880 RepID=UPI00119832E0|nr:ClpXP protease specificity-enhancing factor [Denitratisoma sp. DHT3]QDX79842.1 ClpXP protease specificity-enhancing factor [Denitratisoma sp. DHT3]
MISTKPYLIRAIQEWCVDQGFTPYLQVVVDSRTRVPREYVRDGQIVLNVGVDATHQLLMGNEEITFQARFNGTAFPIIVPVSAVAAIYARENGQGMAFEVAGEASGQSRSLDEESQPSELEPEPGAGTASSTDAPAPESSGAARPKLTRIK